MLICIRACTGAVVLWNVSRTVTAALCTCYGTNVYVYTNGRALLRMHKRSAGVYDLETCFMRRRNGATVRTLTVVLQGNKDVPMRRVRADVLIPTSYALVAHSLTPTMSCCRILGSYCYVSADVQICGKAAVLAILTVLMLIPVLLSNRPIGCARTAFERAL